MARIESNVPLISKQSVTVELLIAMFRIANNEQLQPHHPLVKVHQDNQLNQYIQEARDNLSSEATEHIHLFFHYDNPCTLSLLPTIVLADMSYDELMEWLEQLPSEELFRYFLNYNLVTELRTNEELKNSNVLELLEQTTLPDKERWKMFYFFANTDRMKTRFIALIQTFYTTVFQPSIEDVTNRLEHSLRHLRQIIQLNDVQQLNKAFRTDIIKSSTNDMPIYILPSYFMNTSVIVYQYEEGFICLLGTNRLDVINNSDAMSRQIGEALKALSDEKRIHIIQLLNRAPRYGHELAKELNLTNSTISHHLNALTATGIIKAIRQENKVYYHSDKQRIAEVLQHLTELLTE